jgi:O-antigen biosynthesis protein
MLHILTLTWQGKDKLKQLKESLMPALSDLDYVWHIKDNGSTDGSVDEIKVWNDAKINLMQFPHNRQSYSEGMNLLFKEASPKDSDVILTLNNDVIINDPASLKNMLKILKHDKEVGAVGAKLNYTGTSKIQHCGVLFNPGNGLPYHYRGGVEEEARDRASRYYPVVTGAVSIFPADVFANCCKNKSGTKGFSEDYFFAFEDVDMCMRIGYRLKKKIVYCGDTNIFHEESASLKKNPVHKMFFAKNRKTFIETWAKNIDVTLSTRYEDPAYDLYHNGESK